MPNLMTKGRLPCVPASPRFQAVYRELDSTMYEGVEEKAAAAWTPTFPDAKDATRFDMCAEISTLEGNGLMGSQGRVVPFVHLPHRATLLHANWATHRNADGDVTHWTFKAPWGATFTIFND